MKTCYEIFGSVTTVVLLQGDLRSFSTAGIDESSEHGAVWSRTVEGCFCRELLEAGVDEPIELSEAELLKAAVVGEQLEAH